MPPNMNLIPISITFIILTADGAMTTPIRLPGPQILYPHQQTQDGTGEKAMALTQNNFTHLTRNQMPVASGSSSASEQWERVQDDNIGASNADAVLDSMPSETLFIVTMMKNMLKGKGGGGGYNQGNKMMMRPNYRPMMATAYGPNQGTSYKYGGYGNGHQSNSNSNYNQYGGTNNYGANYNHGGMNYQNSGYSNSNNNYNNYGSGQYSYEYSGEAYNNNYNYNSNNNNNDNNHYNYGQTNSYNNINGGGNYGGGPSAYSVEQGISGEANYANDNGPIQQNQGGYVVNQQQGPQGNQQNGNLPPQETVANNNGYHQPHVEPQQVQHPPAQLQHQQVQQNPPQEVHHQDQQNNINNNNNNKQPERLPQQEFIHNNDIGQDNHVGGGEGPTAVKNYDTLWREFVFNFFTNKYHSPNN